MPVHLVGVRHHSPACARVVAHVLRAVRPEIVLIEGPSDMNGRTDELLLGHTPPIAIYAFAAAARGPRRGSFWPMAAYSPEWVALEVAREIGAAVRFIDLPSYDRVFSSIENHYSDRHLRASARLGDLAAQMGFDDTDSLWDHLFEQPAKEDELMPRLSAYFEALRADEAADPGDRARETRMARFVAWAAAEHREVVVVCGGYHAPELARTWLAADKSEPQNAPPPEGVRTGAYLVPFSFRRLDAFAGYAAGQPSPAFYQEVWEHGPAEGAERMARVAITELRKRQQRVSPADAIAASAMAEGLRRLRGHACLLRRDVLDGLAAALLKEATDAPLPWTRRGVILPRTHPLLVALVDAFSGARIGKLAKETPRPPLVVDALSALEACGIVLGPALVEADLGLEAGRAKSCTLHRLRILGAPGIRRTRAPDFSRGQTRLSETWSAAHSVELEPALIEAAAYGGTLEDAACAVLEERATVARGSGDRAEIVLEAAAAGLGKVAAKMLEALRAGVLTEPNLGELGHALATIHDLLARGAAGFDRTELGALVLGAYDRATWLFEGITGEAAPADEAQVRAVVAMRDVVRGGAVPVDAALASELAARRAADSEAPAYVRGAALGLGLAIAREVVAANGAPIARAEAARAVRGAGRAERLGDFLLGLFAVAREEVRGDVEVVGAVDAALDGMTKHAFAVALPSLRRAFTYFPPRERLSIAEQVLALHASGADPMQLLAPLEADVSRGLAIDLDVTATARRFGLSDALDEGDPA